ncbi:MAG: RNA-directed DNA polymerase, partial [Desulfobacterales bacterium]|nr:RNA-directed DNA polymerase [Desulfobacterales bacterium]
GYHQIKMAPDSRHLTTFVTPSHGLLQYCRAPMGLTDSGAAFQIAVDRILQNLPGVYSYSDDILIGGRTQEEHDSRLAAILKRLLDNDCRLSAEKLIISESTVPMLGRILIATENQPLQILPDKKNVCSITDMESPNSKKGAERFVGAVGFLRDHIPGLTELLTPLRKAIAATPFEWDLDCERCFLKMKELITTPNA